MSADLSGEGNHRRRIHVSVGDSCDKVCSSWTRGCHAEPWFTTCPSIAISCVSCALFMSAQDVSYSRIKQYIVDGQSSSSDNAEDYFCVLSFQGFDESLCSRHLGHFFIPLF